MLSYLNVDVKKLTKQEMNDVDLVFETCKSKFDIKFITLEEFNKKLDLFKRKIKDLNNNEILYMTIYDNDYPESLQEEGILFFTYKGNVGLLKDKMVGFVGTRDCSQEAYENSKYYANFLNEKRYVVVTGLANGIDSAATEGCLLNKGKCIEVLPSSLDKITPKGNEKLLKNVLSKGGLAISTNLPGARIYNSSYHDRNKIIALLSNSIIVGETKTSGGTISTVKYAYQKNKQVYLLNYPKKSPLFTTDKVELFEKKYKAIEITSLTP